MHFDFERCDFADCTQGGAALALRDARRALDWAARRTGGDADTLWVIEGTGSYGAQFAGAVTDAGLEVVEAPRGYVRSRTTTGKSDPLDAAAIAIVRRSAPFGRFPSKMRTAGKDEVWVVITSFKFTRSDQLQTELRGN